MSSGKRPTESMTAATTGKYQKSMSVLIEPMREYSRAVATLYCSPCFCFIKSISIAFVLDCMTDRPIEDRQRVAPNASRTRCCSIISVSGRPQRGFLLSSRRTTQSADGSSRTEQCREPAQQRPQRAVCTRNRDLSVTFCCPQGELHSPHTALAGLTVYTALAVSRAATETSA